jgi:hypothetical protein
VALPLPLPLPLALALALLWPADQRYVFIALQKNLKKT